MARLSTILFDIFFWIAAFCLSPLILCYFILKFIQGCIICLLRLWKCPDANTPNDPFDPDIESSLGLWPESKKVLETVPETKFTNPTVDQVLEVKRIFANLTFIQPWERDDKGVVINSSISIIPWTPPTTKKKSIQVPPEICDMILDLAEYWPCTKTVVSRVMLIGMQSPDVSHSVWMDKERDWRGNTPGASKKTQPWRRTPSHALVRSLSGAPPSGSQEVADGIYLRSFPLGGNIELVVPESIKNAKKISKPAPAILNPKADGGANSNWQTISQVLQRGRWNSNGGVKTELEKRNAGISVSSAGFGNHASVLSSAKVPKKSCTTRHLSQTELQSWLLEIDELYPNLKPGLAAEKFEKKEKKRTRQQWRSFYTMSRFHQWVVPIYHYYHSTREEKFLTETTVRSTEETPFHHKNILVPRLVDSTVSQGEEKKKTAKVRKIIWTIWSKEMTDRSVDERRPVVNPDSSPDLTWYEMFIEEPVPKSSTESEILWKRKYPKGKENILVQRDLGHRIRVGDPRMRIHRVVWDWNDWEDTEPEDDNEVDEGNWRYQGIDFFDLHNMVPSPCHPFRHLNTKNYCDCPFGTKLYWGEGVPSSKTTPISSRIKPEVESASSQSSGSSSSSSGSGSSSSNSASSSSSSDSSSANSLNNPLPGAAKSTPTYIAPNTVLEERIKTGSLRKNGALGKLVRNMRMGDRLVLVARAGGGMGWNSLGVRWDVGVYRAELEVYWAV